MAKREDERRVVLVDDSDTPVGEAGVLESHLAPGRRHRAFTALILDGGGEVVLAQRAEAKLLWPLHWDATVASHPAPDESYEDAGTRRIAEELGSAQLAVPFERCGRFAYDLPFHDVGVENEVCETLLGRLAVGAELAPVADEVAALRTVKPETLVAELCADPEPFCPWLFLALLALRKRLGSLPGELDAPWRFLGAPGRDAELRAALGTHFGSTRWELVD